MQAVQEQETFTSNISLRISGGGALIGALKSRKKEALSPMAFLNETGLKTFLTNCDKRYLKLSGGTLTGALTANGITVKAPNKDKSTIVSTTGQTWGYNLWLVDKNGCRMGSVETYQEKNSKKLQTQLGASVLKKGATVANPSYYSMVIGAYTDEDNSSSGYYLTSPAKFRDTLRITSGSSVPSSDEAGAVFIQV